MLVTTIKPGHVGKVDEFMTEDVERNSKVLTPDTLMDLIRYFLVEINLQKYIYKF